MKLQTQALLTLLLAAAPTVAHAQLALKPGEYSIQTATEMNGQSYPGGGSSRCITAADLKDPDAVFNVRLAPLVSKKDTTCTTKNLHSGAGKISYDTECKDRTVHVEGTVSESEYLVVRDVRPKSPRAPQMKVTLNGKRTGQCSTQ